ncbi:hypothetical protein CB1_001451003 [Camelus ferus]|nr:hypothetical protein CB1_001451003 [Camelus ferus]
MLLAAYESCWGSLKEVPLTVMSGLQPVHSALIVGPPSLPSVSSQQSGDQTQYPMQDRQCGESSMELSWRLRYFIHSDWGSDCTAVPGTDTTGVGVASR